MTATGLEKDKVKDTVKDKVNFEFYDVTTSEKNNCNTHIALYLKE